MRNGVCINGPRRSPFCGVWERDFKNICGAATNTEMIELELRGNHARRRPSGSEAYLRIIDRAAF